MEKKDLARVEAFIFAAEEPIPLKDISNAVDMNKRKCRKCLKKLREKYSKNEHGIILKEYDDKYIFKTKSQMASFISKYYEKEREVKLSSAALETLSIIAYKQPVTRSEIEEIRGVKAEKTLLTLSKYDLIKELGRKDSIGNPILYGTTDKFLEHFDIADLSELPPLEDNKKNYN
ncbi:MAG: SMC-Scp complex subunit ScpB [Bacillota bacterium]